MKHIVITEAAAAPVGADLVSAAARCWRTARDAGDAPAPPLHALLAGDHGAMLAAAFDSLLGLYEQALGRGLSVGWTAGLSEDEQLLANLLRGADALPRCLAIDEGPARSFDCALCSTRILIAIAGEERR
ncbi:hypothetical protein [Sphingopyxis sp. KK2]|uniref:hypothetical protein n=1 Tax=Sphingopyxis sp. KK2 TaxID=1855727 RepID=UPI00097E62D3|nr:hypothetical protein [Sphingopyxis sp. KK2]